MEGIRTKSTMLEFALWTLIFAAFCSVTCAQTSPEIATDEVASEPPLSGEALQAYLTSQLELLDRPEFRARELAAFRLEQYPDDAIKLIAKSAPLSSLNSASQQISLLDRFLSHPDTRIKTKAYDTLKEFSLTKTTALASLAASSVKAIEDDFEQKAYEILTNAGADIGYLDININGSKLNRSDLGVELSTGKFTGDASTLTWIRYLKSVKVVSLEGEFASAQVLALVAQMAGVKKILLRGTYVRPGYYSTKLKPSDLLVLKDLPEIQHFEVKYMSIDDSFVPVLCQLPLTESLRLFGTAISEQGKFEIAQRLDGLEIYRGGGGFLGIGSAPIGPVKVTQVTADSAAENAGIQEDDIILEIDGTPIKNFAGLRATLANYGPNELIVIKLKRLNPRTIGSKQLEYFEHQLFVVLNEQTN
ncbi:MAG: PDZ domain-containing protein [Pirellulaceae bacterium]|nr:PDZ domain-containing protein [Pirellulaceae bacterium]